MRWFKHMAEASTDRFIVELESEFGLPGYARWFKLIETIAFQMKKPGQCSATLRWDTWCSVLRGKPKTIEKFLNYCAGISDSKPDGSEFVSGSF